MNHKVLISALLCCIHAIVLAQVERIDSLKRELSSTENEETTVSIHLDLGKSYLEYKPDSSYYFLKMAAKGAEKQRQADVRAVAVMNLSKVEINFGKYDSALVLAREALGLFQEMDDKPGIAETLRLLGVAYSNKGVYDSAILCLNRSLEIFISENNVQGQAEAFNVKGNIAQKQGNYPLASSFLHRALTLYQSNDNKRGQADVLNNIGIIYEYQGQYEKALENYNEFYKVYKELNEGLGIAIGLHNAGIILKKLENYDSAIYNFREALKEDQKINSRDGIAYDKKELGQTYFLKGERDSAMTFFRESLIIAREVQDPVVIVPTLIGIGTIYLKVRNYDSAVHYLEKALMVAETVGLENERLEAAHALFEVYDGSGNTQKALQYHLLYSEIKDALFNEENIRKLASIEAQNAYDNERREAEIQSRLSELQKNREVAEAIWLRNTSILGAILISLVAFFFYQNYQRKRQANKELKLLYEELKAAHKEIREINLTLEDRIAERTRLLKEKNEKLKAYMHSNSHVVRAPLARILGLADSFDTLTQEEVELDFIIENIYNSAQELDDAIREINEAMSSDSDE